MQLKGFFAQLYFALLTHIKEAVPAIRYIDQDMGQLEDYNPEDPTSRPPVAWPCVLIDFPEANYTDDGQLEQTGDVMVDVRLGLAPYSPSTSNTPRSVTTKALEFYALEQQLTEALHGWTPVLPLEDGGTVEICQPLARRGAGTEKREDSLRVRVIRLTTSYSDSTVDNGITTITAPLAITYCGLPEPPAPPEEPEVPEDIEEE